MGAGSDRFDRWKKGDWLTLCDVCGFKHYASELRERWDGRMVCRQDWELRHPQDLIRLPRAERGIPWARSWNTAMDKFVGTNLNPVGPSQPVNSTFVLGPGQLG